MHLFSVVVFAVVIAVLRYGDARPSYVNSIPNGNLVPNPCGNGGNWQALGHNTPSNGVGLNQFGRDFQAAGLRWTVELCRKDSDGDGRTNGDELGDPTCQWTPGATPARTTNLGNPAICEPVASDACRSRNAFLNTNTCPALNNNNNGGQSPPVVPFLPPAPGQVTGSPQTQQNSWILQRNCVCYCMDESMFANFRGMMGGYYNQQQTFQATPNSQIRNQPLYQSRGRTGQRKQGRGGFRQQQQQQQGGQSGFFGGQHGGFMAPPINQTPEFQDTNGYKVSRPCICACPKSYS